MDFVAIDVETANPSRASICQIGIVTFEGGAVKETWQALVNPEEAFDPRVCKRHKTTAESVKDSPTFAGIHEAVVARLYGRIIVSHTPFDSQAIEQVCRKYALRPIEGTWLDTAEVARQAWPEFSGEGHKLKDMAQRLGIEFEHHNAMEDARVAGLILVEAIRKTGIPLDVWLEGECAKTRPQVRKPSRHTAGVEIVFPPVSVMAELLTKYFGDIERIAEATEDELQQVEGVGPEVASSIRQFFNSAAGRKAWQSLRDAGVNMEQPKTARSGEQPLAGKTIVVTGTLENWGRNEVERLIKELGGKPVGSVSRKTDFVLAGTDPGSKVAKARDLKVKIIDEKEFLRMIGRGGD